MGTLGPDVLGGLACLSWWGAGKEVSGADCAFRGVSVSTIFRFRTGGSAKHTPTPRRIILRIFFASRRLGPCGWPLCLFNAEYPVPAEFGSNSLVATKLTEC